MHFNYLLDVLISDVTSLLYLFIFNEIPMLCKTIYFSEGYGKLNKNNDLLLHRNVLFILFQTKQYAKRCQILVNL